MVEADKKLLSYKTVFAFSDIIDGVSVKGKCAKDIFRDVKFQR